jgi:hypothetical protein
LGREIQAYTQNRAVREPSVSDALATQGEAGSGGGEIVFQFVDRLTALQPVPKGKQKPELELRRQNAHLAKLSKDQTKQLLAMNQEALNFTTTYASSGGLMVSQFLITRSQLNEMAMQETQYRSQLGLLRRKMEIKDEIRNCTLLRC